MPRRRGVMPSISRSTFTQNLGGMPALLESARARRRNPRNAPGRSQSPLQLAWVESRGVFGRAEA